MPKNRIWIVCESGDRWYRAVCRFGQERSNSSPGRIQRVASDAFAEVANVARLEKGRAIIIWEFNDAWDETAARLEVVSSLRRDLPNLIHLAWFPADCGTDLILASREAGIQFFLSDLASVQKLSKALNLSGMS